MDLEPGAGAERPDRINLSFFRNQTQKGVSE